MTDGVYGWLCTILIAFIAAFFAGWVVAHQEISTECVRQGSFYFNDIDFECSVRHRAEGEL